ncbi:ribosome recycling factor [Patescibacteria group bacterium]|nr:ribosome recycling factor [Patescibacteria group bacterium]MBU2473070.1 ribosome recycling factor [Patescibacteria group bacterium]
MYKEAINKIKPKLEKTIDYLKNELLGLQAGRATPSLIENLEINAYGQKMLLKELAAIQVPEPRLIVIRPWDREIITNIVAAIRESKIGISPVTEEDFIRLNIPPLSEERRKELVKIVNEKIEECKVSIRRSREEVWKEIQEMEKNKEITEDGRYKGKDELQKLIDEYNKKIDEIKKKKEEEIMTV